MILQYYELERLRGYPLDAEDVAEIIDVFGPELAEHGITFSKATCDYIEKCTGEKPDKAVMLLVDLVEKDMTRSVVWTNGIQVVNKY